MAPDQYLLISALVSSGLCLVTAVCVLVAFLYTKHMSDLAKAVTRATNAATEELGGRMLSDKCQNTVTKVYDIKDWTGQPVAKEFFDKLYNVQKSGIGEESTVNYQNRAPQQDPGAQPPQGQPQRKEFRDSADPQYQTLAVVPADVWGPKKDDDPAPAPVQQPDQFKDAHDPQYQTLAGIDDKVFMKN